MSDQAVRLPLWQAAVEQLESSNQIAYGSLIEWETLVKCFAAQRDSWEFRQEYFGMVEFLNSRGFILSERGTNGRGVRILERFEMAEWVRSQEYQKAHRSIKNALILGSVDRSGLPDEESAKLDYWQSKAAVNGIESLRRLNDPQLPATPEMPIKSIAQIK